MADNKKLKNAKAVKNDEFFTEYSTISDEVSHYRDQFKGKIVYCNCDDPTWSNFWKYFHSNFASLGLRKLICTHYSKDGSPSYALIYEGGDDFNMEAGTTVEIFGNDGYNAGDFRSDACVGLLMQADICISNPPFSLFIPYMNLLVSSGKSFLVLGNQNASHNKDIFPLIKDNKIWYGASIHSGGVDFRMPDDYESYSDNVFIKNGHHYINLAGIRWFTNMDVKYRHDGLWHHNGKFDQTQAHSYYEGNEDRYPRYYNFDGIDVDSAGNIPIDYPGYMGVPITIFDKYNPDEIEIIGIGRDGYGITVDRSIYSRIKELNPSCRPSHIGYWDNGKPKEPFSRIIIRNLHPIKKADDLGY